MQHTWMWVTFAVVVTAMMALDLGVFHRKAHSVRPREALLWSVVWVTMAAMFAGVLWRLDGHQTALEFTAGYVVEQALSVDNLFVFLLLFSYFKVPETLQHRVLFWGILGALVLRGIMIGAGAALLGQFHWIIYLFGAFLVFTGIRMLAHDDDDMEPGKNPVLRLVRRIVPITENYVGDHFFTRQAWGPDRIVRTVATPLFVVLVLVETTDVVFAVDSIPAVFGVTRDPFVVYSSNIFAILGLRSMFFLLSAVMHRFWMLKPALSIVLILVGVKMLLETVWHIPTLMSLLVIVAILVGAVTLSLVFPRRDPAPVEAAPPVAPGPAPTGTR